MVTRYMLQKTLFNLSDTDLMLHIMECNAATKKNYPSYKYILLIGVRFQFVSVLDCTLNTCQAWI